MSEYGRAWQVVRLPSKKMNLVYSVMTQIILILACFYKGTLSQKVPGYNLEVPRSVIVQRNSSVHIHCQFTYNARDNYWDEKLFAYWFKVQEGACLNHRPCLPGLLVATTDGRRTVATSAKGRFHLTGDPNQGYCSFVIVDAQAEDKGRYYLRIEGERYLKFSYFSKNGYISPYVFVTDHCQDIQITWTIERPGSFPVQETLGPVVAQEGDTVTLYCVDASRTNPNLIWTKGKNSNGILKQGREHVISQIKPEDAGEYQCQGEYQCGLASKTILVTVQYKPKTVTFNISQISRRHTILTQGFLQEVVSGSGLMAQEGESLRLWCKVDSNPSVSIRWIKPDGKSSKEYADNSLELTELTVEDEGEYRCQAENFLGSTQGTFQLYVGYAPKLKEDPQRNTTCWYQDNGFLCNCSLKAQPPPQIQWQVDGESITETNHKRNQMVTSVAQGNEVTSTLNWTGNLEVDHNIICIGNNSFGIYRIQLLLSVLRDSTDSSIESHTTMIISGLFGILLGASFFMLGLFLLKFYKRKASPKAGCNEAVDSANVGYQKASSNSLIYSNILPVGRRTPHVGPPKTAGQKNVKPDQISKVADLTTDESDGLHYAALEFKLNKTATPIEEEESVEYSAVKRK
ncbi:sialic acid-binding Ig-like lectin 10 [Sceloporus undulatus]|uniref:sialic acid-binding Ig-like lectin 10 n=1 Tax=Sceloporus undulatus TaxID=8520 RepID=UPI001C4D238F|nr:sialic acid-binding Ig-like lectin 10 [Sceloporus undulatus]